MSTKNDNREFIGNGKRPIDNTVTSDFLNEDRQKTVALLQDEQGDIIGVDGAPMQVSLPSINYDLFGKIKVAEPHKLFEWSATRGLDLVRYHTISEIGGGTVTEDLIKTQIHLTTTAAAGDKAVFQTRRAIQYNRGNSQEIFIIYKPNAIPNRRERWGYFNEGNGPFFEHDGTNPRLVIRSNTSGAVVDTPIERADWLDPLDGSGPSGLTIDWTKQTVFLIEFGWLSSRGVRFSIDIGGIFVTVASWLISNKLAVPFMRHPNLPLRLEVENTGVTSGAVTSSMSCWAVQSSGSDIQEGPVRSLSTGVGAILVSNTEIIAAGVRLQAGKLNASLLPSDFVLLPLTGNDYLYYKVIYNPTLVGDIWVNAPEGIAQTLVSATSYTGGSILDEGHIPLGTKNTVSDSFFQKVLDDVYVGSDLDGTGDALVITFETNTGNGSVFFSAKYKEFI